jgi:hypothetical protein
VGDAPHIGRQAEPTADRVRDGRGARTASLTTRLRSAAVQALLGAD